MKMKKSILIFIFVFFIFLLCLIVFILNKNNKISISDISYVSLNNSIINDNNLYYIDNNKLVVVDKDNNKKKICNNIKNITLNFIDDNELYYKDSNNKKINLSNCKITDLKNDYEYLLYTKNNKYMYVVDKKDSFNLIKYDYKNNKKLNEIKTNKNILEDKYIINDNNIYYVINEEERYRLYLNNKVVYESEDEFSLLAVSNNYIILYDEYTVYKLNKNNYEIIQMLDNPYNSLFIINSNNGDSYFNSVDRIFKYDEELDTFISISEIDSLSNYYSFDINNSVVFNSKSNNIIIYNKLDQKSNKYNGISSFSYDNSKVYIIDSNRELIIVE